MTLRFFARYLGAWAGYGFYRGWNADYRYNRYDGVHPITVVRHDLQVERYLDKLVRGLTNATLYGTFGHMIALYRLAGRLEIAMTNKDPYNHILVYTEFMDHTTLPPTTVQDDNQHSETTSENSSPWRDK